MQILIVGFQRSGTTLLRRLLHQHPHVRQVFHEKFLLRECNTKEELIQFVDSKGINPLVENWGEKAPFYPAVRGIPVIEYCKRWTRYFGSTSRILHTIRHPIDVALSVVKKRRKGGIDHPLKIYTNLMRSVVPKIENMKNSFSFKYEDLITNPDEVLPQIYEFCGIDKDVDFRAFMSMLKNPKYQTFDSSRAFAYKKNPPKIQIKLDSTINVINRKIGGVDYKV